MSKLYAAITAIGGYVPETVLDNAALEKMVDTTDEWILSRTGIKERRIAGPQMATSDMATLAIKDLLENADIDAADIDCVLLATSTPDYVLAPTAALVCHKAGLINAFGMDLNAACSGFLYALSTGGMFIETGRYKKVLVIGADKMSSIVNYEDRNTCVLFGDGAGVVLLEATQNSAAGIQDNLFLTDGLGATVLSVPAGGSEFPASAETIAGKKHFVQQDGRTVFKNAIKGMSNACLQLLEKNSLTINDVDWVIPHQANLRIIDAVGDRLQLPKEKVKVNIQRYGNTTAGTLPLCLWDFKNDFKPGDKLLLTAFGAGFTWGATYLIWGDVRTRKN